VPHDRPRFGSLTWSLLALLALPGCAERTAEVAPVEPPPVAPIAEPNTPTPAKTCSLGPFAGSDVQQVGFGREIFAGHIP
jgi:hypothetical protein